MLKRTPGKWIWGLSQEPETLGKPGIFVEGEGPELTPMIGDMVLMAAAPEMYELLWRVAEILPCFSRSLYLLTDIIESQKSCIQKLSRLCNMEINRLSDTHQGAKETLQAFSEVRDMLLNIIAEVNVEPQIEVPDSLRQEIEKISERRSEKHEQ